MSRHGDGKGRISGSGRAVAAIRKDRQPYTLNPTASRHVSRGSKLGLCRTFPGVWRTSLGIGCGAGDLDPGVCAFREKDQATSPETPRKLREESRPAEV